MLSVLSAHSNRSLDWHRLPDGLGYRFLVIVAKSNGQGVQVAKWWLGRQLAVDCSLFLHQLLDSDVGKYPPKPPLLLCFHKLRVIHVSDGKWTPSGKASSSTLALLPNR